MPQNMDQTKRQNIKSVVNDLADKKLRIEN